MTCFAIYSQITLPSTQVFGSFQCFQVTRIRTACPLPCFKCRTYTPSYHYSALPRLQAVSKPHACAVQDSSISNSIIIDRVETYALVWHVLSHTDTWYAYSTLHVHCMSSTVVSVAASNWLQINMAAPCRSDRTLWSKIKLGAWFRYIFRYHISIQFKSAVKALLRP